MSCALAYTSMSIEYFISENIRHISVTFGVSVSKCRYTNFYFSLHQSNVAPTLYNI
jgi:hypothetical protein